MKKTLFAFLVFLVIVANIVNNKTDSAEVDLLHLPNGIFAIGYSYDITGKTVYGAATPVSYTDKFLYVYAGDIAISVSKTDKWYTDDVLTSWIVYTLEIAKSEDECWLDIEIGF